jgi:hypothetical protein
VDCLYLKGPFAGDREKVEHLFGIFEKLTAPSLPPPENTNAGAKDNVRGPEPAQAMLA